VLPRAAVEGQRRRLARLTLAERAAIPCLEPGRADLIIPGIGVVMATMDVLAMDAMQVSDWGIREGIIAEMIGAGP
jgi:exopolyphosphatase/guanosine-5'-triphosphate,3'-diphosphate pyrophosphatase